MCVLSFNCKPHPFTLALDSGILTRLSILNFIMVNSTDTKDSSKLPYLVRGHTGLSIQGLIPFYLSKKRLGTSKQCGPS